MYPQKGAVHRFRLEGDIARTAAYDDGCGGQILEVFFLLVGIAPWKNRAVFGPAGKNDIGTFEHCLQPFPRQLRVVIEQSETQFGI